MAREFVMRKKDGALVPTCEAGEQALGKIPDGDDVLISVKRPRNVRHHKKMFGLLNLVLANSDYKTIDQLLIWIKVRLGYVEIFIFPDGRTAFVPKSISFTSMDQAQFEEFYSSVIDLVITDIMPGITRDTLEREVAEICGIGAFYRR